MEDERYAFEVEWFDAQAELMRRYIFTYFVRHSGNNEIEMVRSGRVARAPEPPPPRQAATPGAASRASDEKMGTNGAADAGVASPMPLRSTT